MTYIQPVWPAPVRVKAYTSLRQNGYSAQPFATFNLAQHVGDDQTAVIQNRQKLHHDLVLPSEPCWLSQQHTTKVIEFAKDESDSSVVVLDINNEAEKVKKLFLPPIADASFTHNADVVCAVLTADCLPLLICDKKANVVAAIHAGWRGLAAGIIEETLGKIKQKGINPMDLLIWLGPAIGPRAFEVDEEVYQTFMAFDACADAAFKTILRDDLGMSKKWLADIYLLARQRLFYCGVPDTAIYGGNYCTYSEADKFFSYRREHGVTGRMASLIWLQGN